MLTTFGVKVPQPSPDARSVVARVVLRHAHERKILTSPGAAEGFDHTYKLIAAWKLAHGCE